MDDFHKQIIENRNNKREENLKEDLLIWTKINTLNESEVKLSFNDNIKCQLDPSKYKNSKEEKAIVEKIESIVSTIFRIHSDYFKINTIEQIGFSDVKEYTQWILNLDKEMQLHFCKNPTKQGVDEKFQIMKLHENISSIGLYAIKPPKTIYIRDGETHRKKMKNTVVKSVDVLVSNSDDLNLDSIENNSNLIFLGYTKTVITEGGHQGNQFADVEGFIKEAYKFSKRHPSRNIYFFGQLDGDASIRYIPQIQKSIKDNDKIHVDTTMSLVDWILEIYEKKKVQVS